jgi:hypothetical protein
MRNNIEEKEAKIWCLLEKRKDVPDEAWYLLKGYHQKVFTVACWMQTVNAFNSEPLPTEAVLAAIKAMPNVLGYRTVSICLKTMASTLVFHMTDEEMTDFGGFMAAIKKVAPDFDQEKDNGWMQWTAVRIAIWNDKEIYVPI